MLLLAIAPWTAGPEPTEGLLAALRSAVIVETVGETGALLSSAAGVVVDSAGGVVTALHAVEGAPRIAVGTGPGRPATLRASEPSFDLALLEVDPSEATPPPPALAPEPAIGQEVFAIGNPLGSGLVVTRGIVAALPDSGADPSTPEGHLLIDALVAEGSSGGPVVDAAGRWIGMVVGKAVVDQTVLDLGMVVPAARVLEAVERLAARPPLPAASVGIEVATMSAPMAAALGVSPGLGVVVSRVRSAGPGNRAGLSPMDVITAVDGRPVRSARELDSLVQARHPGEELKLSVSTDGHGRILRVELDEQPAQLPPDTAPAEVTEIEGLGLTVAQLGGIGSALAVVSVARRGRAEGAGIRRGDWIDLVGRRPASAAALRAELRRQSHGARALLLRIRRGDSVRLTAIELNDLGD